MVLWCQDRASCSGAGGFFGEPALEVSELLKTDRYGKGFIHILEANELSQSPRLYGTVLLWLLAELFEDLPEAGDVAKPRLVLIFDEAHLMFDDAPKALLEKTEQVARLIRSKGVGLYFVTQSQHLVQLHHHRQPPAHQLDAGADARPVAARPGEEVEPLRHVRVEVTDDALVQLRRGVFSTQRGRRPLGPRPLVCLLQAHPAGVVKQRTSAY